MHVVALLFACGGSEAVSLEGAPASSASSLEITDGSIEVGKLTTYERDCGTQNLTTQRGQKTCVESTTRIAPIRGAGEQGPVRAWAVCHSSVKTDEACRAVLQKAAPSGRVLWRYEPEARTVWANAIAEAGQPSVGDAPILLIQ